MPIISKDDIDKIWDKNSLNYKKILSLYLEKVSEAMTSAALAGAYECEVNVPEFISHKIEEELRSAGYEYCIYDLNSSIRHETRGFRTERNISFFVIRLRDPRLTPRSSRA